MRTRLFFTRFAWIAGWFCIFSTESGAATADDEAKLSVALYAASTNGTLDADQLNKFLISYWKSKTLLDPDLLKPDNNGSITQTQFDAATAARALEIENRVNTSLTELWREGSNSEKTLSKDGNVSTKDVAAGLGLAYHDPTPEDQKNVADQTPPPKPKDPVQPFFALRKTSGLLDSDFYVTQKDGKDVLGTGPSDSGALLSFNRNLSTPAAGNTWTAQGSIGAPVRFDQDSAIGLTALWFVPSIDFNHLGGSAVAAKSQIDSLAFSPGVLLTLGWPAGSPNKPTGQTLDIRLAQVTQTDFSFESLLLGGELELEYQNPVLCQDPVIGLGAPFPLYRDRQLNACMDLIPRATVKFDGGVVENAGTKRVKDGARYARVGPSFSLTLAPDAAGIPNDIIHYIPIAQASYSHYLGLLGRAYDDYNANFKWDLTGDGTIAVTISYDHGGLNPNGDKSNQLTAGLTLKH